MTMMTMTTVRSAEVLAKMKADPPKPYCTVHITHHPLGNTCKTSAEEQEAWDEYIKERDSREYQQLVLFDKET